MVNKAQPEDTSVHETTLGIIPEQPRDEGRKAESHEQNQLKVPPVLPPHNRVLRQVTDVCNTGLAPGLQQHPSHVTVPKAFVGIVRVEFGVGVPMVGTVTATPPLDRTLDGTRSEESEKVLQRKAGVVCAVGPKTVVSRGDAEAGAVVVEDGEKGGLPLKRGVDGAEQANEGGDEKNAAVEVVELGEKVAPGHRGTGFCGLEGVLDIVVGDVEVGGDDLFDEGRLGRWGADRHGGGGREGMEGGEEEEKTCWSGVSSWR